MRTLLCGVILGLLAVVHSTPVNTVTQIPIKSEDDVLREAATDGFLIDHLFLPSITTESPKKDPTVQASRETLSDGIEGSAGGEASNETMTSVFVQHGSGPTTQSISHAPVSTSTVLPGATDSSGPHSSTTQSPPVSTSTVLPGATDSSGPHSSTTQSPQSNATSSSVPNEPKSSVSPDHVSVSTYPAITSSFAFLSTQSSDGDGSGDGEMPDKNPAATSSTTTKSQTSSAPSTSAASRQMFEGGEGSGTDLGSGLSQDMPSKGRSLIEPHKYPVLDEPQKVEEQKPALPQNKGHSTPGWIIIVGFIVGLAALVMLCLAIATRDKWNGPKHAAQPETKTNSSNQQRELEMETFLHKDNPRENGKASEYTVIPLDELPDKYASH